jgi:hypothetical protein
MTVVSGAVQAELFDLYEPVAPEGYARFGWRMSQRCRASRRAWMPWCPMSCERRGLTAGVEQIDVNINREILCSGIGSDMLRLDPISVGADGSRRAARRSAPGVGEIRLLIRHKRLFAYNAGC